MKSLQPLWIIWVTLIFIVATPIYILSSEKTKSTPSQTENILNVGNPGIITTGYPETIVEEVNFKEYYDSFKEEQRPVEIEKIFKSLEEKGFNPADTKFILITESDNHQQPMEKPKK